MASTMARTHAESGNAMIPSSLAGAASNHQRRSASEGSDAYRAPTIEPAARSAAIIDWIAA